MKNKSARSHRHGQRTQEKVKCQPGAILTLVKHAANHHAPRLQAIYYTRTYECEKPETSQKFTKAVQLSDIGYRPRKEMADIGITSSENLATEISFIWYLCCPHLFLPLSLSSIVHPSFKPETWEYSSDSPPSLTHSFLATYF